MSINGSEGKAFKIIARIKNELEDIQTIASAREMRDRVQNLLRMIQEETYGNKKVFMEMIHNKIRESRDNNPELNTHLYMLYRNLSEDKLTMEEAQKIYEMCINEY